MHNDKTFLAIIPARGGSKRLPNKNILPLAGKPLLAWSIEAALNSEYIDKVIVSSDDKEILNVSKEWAVETIERPKVLATDDAKTVDVVLDIIYKLNNAYDYIVLLQPTSPLRKEKHIDEAIELLFKKNADAIVSVCEAEYSPLWCNILPENGDMSGFLKEEIKNKRSQDLPKYYRINGAIYICKRAKLLAEKTFFIKKRIYAYIMDWYASIDIDNEFDFKIVNCLKQLEKRRTKL